MSPPSENITVDVDVVVVVVVVAVVVVVVEGKHTKPCQSIGCSVGQSITDLCALSVNM